MSRDNPVTRIVTVGEVALLIAALLVGAFGYLVWRVYRKKELVVSATAAIAREESCCVLYANVADGVDSEQGYAIRNLLNDAGTIGWWFVNPGSFVAIFASKDSSRSASCREALAKLAAENPSWPSMSIGASTGSIYGAFNGDGILESMPTGGVVTNAMRKALEAAHG